MPKAVRDIEFTHMPSLIEDLHSYDSAFLLIRYHSVPAGKIILPVKNGKVNLEQHRTAIQNAIRKKIEEATVDNFLFGKENRKQIATDLRVSIAVCTRNRTEDLRLCLDALMKLPQKGQEVLIIDNAPSTDTAEKLVQQYPSVRYIREERKGLNIARNRAIAEAKYEIVAFTDDDAFVDTNWLDALMKNFDHPLVMCVTGMTMPFELETKAQEAIEHYSPFGKGFSRKEFSYFNSNPLITGNVGAGANMAIRKELIKETGGFDEALDAGTVTQSGGDHEFFTRILLAGYHIVYEPEALSWHKHRRSWQEAKTAIKGYGIGVYAMWTRLFFLEKQYSVLRLPAGWFMYTQLPNLINSILRKKERYPLSFLIIELQGCLKGPFAYRKSKKNLRKQLKPQSK